MIDTVKNKKRKEIEERIKNSNIKGRIHISKDELEYLLFDVVKCTYSVVTAKIEEAKFLVWSGPFLSKIDLSEVDFSNVVWDINYEDNNCNRYYLDNGITEINLSNTNANINFTKGHSFREEFCPTISGCNFSGTDLSKSFDWVTETKNYTSYANNPKLYINNSNFKNTNFKLDINNIYEAYSNDFSNNDFSTMNIKKEFILDNPNNNFSNTGINIIDKEHDKTDLYDEIFRKNNLEKCYFMKNLCNNIENIDELNIAKYLGEKGKIDKQIKKARKEYEKLIYETNPKERIHIDKDLLESLLFETKILYKRYPGEKIKMKFLVWSGPFLSKIDLSEVSFDDVEWDIDYDIGCYEEKVIEDTDCKELEKFSEKNKWHNVNIYHLNNVHQIDLSNTNAKIVFSKSISGITEGKTVLRYCNFSGTDLSNNTINECYISDCDLSNTGIKISNKIWESLSKYNSYKFFYIQVTNLSNNNLSNPYSIVGSAFNDHIYECNLDNTGINIFVDEDDKIDEVVKKCSIKGCLINGKKRNEYEKEKEINKISNKIEEYESLLKDVEDSARSIKEQIEQLKLELNLKKIEYEQDKTDEEINQLKLQLKSQEIK